MMAWSRSSNRVSSSLAAISASWKSHSVLASSTASPGPRPQNRSNWAEQLEVHRRR